MGTEWTEAVIFLYLILVMVLRPRGLLGEETREPDDGEARMDELKAQIQEWRDAWMKRVPTAPRWAGGRWSRPGLLLGIACLIVFPFLFSTNSGFISKRRSSRWPTW